MPLGPLRLQEGPLGHEQRLAGDREDAEIELRIDQPAGLGCGDFDSHLLEQAQNRAGLDRARGVVVPRDQDDGCVREGLAEALKLAEGEEDRVVGGSHRVKQVSSDDNHVRRRGDDAVYGGAKSLGYIGLSLVDAAWSLPVVLTDAEMRIRDVCEFHRWRMKTGRGKGKNLGSSHTARRHVSERGFPAWPRLLPR
jgi:hypothetical protein